MSKQAEIEGLFALIYRDDGPRGICTQCGSVTSPWEKLFLFETETKMRAFAEEIKICKFRLNPRIERAFYPNPYGNDEVRFIEG